MIHVWTNYCENLFLILRENQIIQTSCMGWHVLNEWFHKLRHQPKSIQSPFSPMQLSRNTGIMYFTSKITTLLVILWDLWYTTPLNHKRNKALITKYSLKPNSTIDNAAGITYVYRTGPGSVNSLRLRQNGRLFADDIFQCIFLKENVWTSVKIWLQFVLKVWINNIPALVWQATSHYLKQWWSILLTHICVTRPQ